MVKYITIQFGNILEDLFEEKKVRSAAPSIRELRMQLQNFALQLFMFFFINFYHIIFLADCTVDWLRTRQNPRWHGCCC
jgi:uncharacterized membrane protein (DUF485 family)